MVNRMKKKVVIIGAGPAGLTATWELARDEKYEVCVLEASDIVGGMAKTIAHNGNYIDLGGHRFYSKEKSVLDWWKNIFSDEEEPEFLLRERVTHIFYHNQFFTYPITLSLENLKKLGMKKSLKVGLDYLKACMRPQKEDSLETFYQNRFGKELYSMFFEEYTEKLCGVHPREISSKWGEDRIRGLSIGAILNQSKSKKGQQIRDGLLPPSLFYYPKYGPGQLWEKVARQAMEAGAEILFNHKVESLHQNEQGQTDYVVVQTEEGKKQIEGDIFLSSMPLRELVAGLEDTPVEIQELAEKMPYRAFVTVGLLVDKVKQDWKDCWIYIQDERVKVCRVQFYDNWSPYLQAGDGKYNFLALEYYCQENDEFWSMSEEACVKIAIEEAVMLGIIERDTKILDFHREQIAQAYPGYYGAYQEIETLKAYVSGIKNLICIGRNGLHEYWNMDKCMISAWEAVKKLKVF